MNWRIPIGVFLITSAVFGLVSKIIEYKSRSWKDWPVGVEIASFALITLGVYLIRKEINKRDKLKRH